MNEDLGQFGGSPRPNFSINALAEIQDAGPDNEPPTLITETMLSGIERESIDVVRVNRVANETAGC